jgi:hypothetical protein
MTQALFDRSAIFAELFGLELAELAHLRGCPNWAGCWEASCTCIVAGSPAND